MTNANLSKVNTNNEPVLFPVFGKMEEFTGKSVMGFMEEDAVMRWIQSGIPPRVIEQRLPLGNVWQTIAWSGWPKVKKDLGVRQYSQRVYVHFRNLSDWESQRLYSSIRVDPYTHMLFTDTIENVLSVIVKADYCDEVEYRQAFNQVVDYYQRCYSIPQRQFTVGNDYFGKRYKVPHCPKMHFRSNSKEFTVKTVKLEAKQATLISV